MCILIRILGLVAQVSTGSTVLWEAQATSKYKAALSFPGREHRAGETGPKRTPICSRTYTYVYAT